MMKRNLILIFFIFIFSLAIVFGLQFMAGNTSNNGFNRTIVQPEIHIENSLVVNSNSILFAGIIGKRIVLHDPSSPPAVYKVDTPYSHVDQVKLSVTFNFTGKSNYLNVGVTKNSYYFTNSSGDVTVVGSHGNYTRLYEIPDIVFDQSKALSNSSVIVRGVTQEKHQKQRELTKIRLSDKPEIQKRLILRKQVDGFFCNDGWLDFDARQERLLYTYYYRGEFLCLDTNLNLIYKSKTIDTVKKAKIKFAVTKTKFRNGTEVESVSLTSPPPIVNRCFTIFNNRVYISSALKADNETLSAFTKNHIIDVYSLVNGKYLNSFYLPKFKGLPLRQFRVRDNILMSLSGNYLAIYNFSMPN